MQVYSCMTMFFHLCSPRVDTEYYLKGLTEKEVEEEGEEVTLRKHGEIGTSRYFSVRSRRLFFFYSNHCRMHIILCFVHQSHSGCVQENIRYKTRQKYHLFPTTLAKPHCVILNCFVSEFCQWNN